MLYKRRGVWWYEFSIKGQRVRESTCSRSKVVAREAARHRREQLVESINGLNKRPKPMLFSVAAKDYLKVKEKVLRPSSYRIEKTSINHLTPTFGPILISDIDGAGIAAYQRKRRAERAAAKTGNLETDTLRAILKRNKLWAFIQEDVRKLREHSEAGTSLTPDQESALLDACTKSRSRSLYPAVALLGPRQVGKTTLAVAIAAAYPGALFLDLERESDRAVLAHPELSLVAQRDRLVVLDEVQFVPGLFSALRPEIDAYRRPGRFLLLGSASGNMLR
jgi:hypothetical protein